ncbi:MAG: hypothetical protein M0Z71_03340 [Nitrospiraceae bacterium]|nr:hypothetical protein [Nitrospiraceae bacterium]
MIKFGCHKEKGRIKTKKKAMIREASKKAEHDLERWRKSHEDINVLRKAYREKILNWVVTSMEFEKEPVSMTRLKELLEREKTAHAW